MAAVTALIVIPVFNTEKYILECLESIKAQTFKQFICIIVDDGSTDHSAQIIKDFIAEEQTDRFIFFTKTNGGVSSARNYALDKAQELKLNPDYLFFVDSDDYVAAKFLDRMISAMADNQCDYSVCGFYDVAINGIMPKSQRTSDQIVRRLEIAEHSFVAGKFSQADNTSTIGLYNKGFQYCNVKDIRFNANISVGEDMLYFASCLGHIHSGVILMDNLYYYRMRKSSAMHAPQNTEKGLFSIVKAFKEAVRINKGSECCNVIVARFFIILYDAFKKSVYLKSKQSHELFNELDLLLSTYPDLVPKTHYKRVNRIKIGYKLTVLYLKMRKLFNLKTFSHNKENYVNYFE